MELSGTHGWRWPHEVKIMVMVWTHVMIKLRNLKRRKRKTKWAQGKGDIYRAILFWGSRYLESVITFRIDGRTIKRGALIG